MLWGKVHFFTKEHRHFISVQKTPPFHFLPNTGPVNDKAKLFLLSALATVAAPSNGISAVHLPCIRLEFTSRPSTVTQNIALSSIHLRQMCRQLRYVYRNVQQWRRQGEGGKLPPLLVDVQKLCKMCVFLSLSWNFFVSRDEYIARPSSKEPR